MGILQEKASASELRAIVREAWQREEGHLARLQRLAESKVSAADLAAVAVVAEGKASAADLETAVQRQVQRRLDIVASDKQWIAKSDIAALLESSIAEVKEKFRQGERRV